MRVLDFTTEKSAERYEILYDGLTGSPRGFEAPSETRILGKILDKLESVGTTIERGTDGAGRPIKTFGLMPGGGVIQLEDAEWVLMNDAIKGVRWRAQAARNATEAIEWLQAAPEPKPKLVEEERGVASNK